MKKGFNIITILTITLIHPLYIQSAQQEKSSQQEKNLERQKRHLHNLLAARQKIDDKIKTNDSEINDTKKESHELFKKARGCTRKMQQLQSSNKKSQQSRKEVSDKINMTKEEIRKYEIAAGIPTIDTQKNKQTFTGAVLPQLLNTHSRIPATAPNEAGWLSWLF